MATRKDVAAMAGVSEATVSYAISGKAPISEATRKRVFAAMDKLHYIPNLMAQGLAGRSSNLIAMLFPSQERGISNADLEYVLGAANAARELGYHLILWPTADRDVEEVIALGQAGLIDGVLLMEVRLEDERVEALEGAGMSVGLIGRVRDESEEVLFADRDFEGAVTDAVDYLAGLGHEHIAFLNGSRQIVRLGFGATVRAEEAFKSSMRSRGLKAVNLYSRSTVDAGRAALRHMVVRHPEITAVVAMNADAVIGFLQEARGQGIAVPTQLSVVSIATPDSFASGTDPELTTISPPATEIGGAAARQLIGRLANLELPREPRLFRGELVVRGSSAPPRAHRNGAPKSGS